MQGERDHGEGPRRMRIAMAGFIIFGTPIKIKGVPTTRARWRWPGRSHALQGGCTYPKAEERDRWSPWRLNATATRVWLANQQVEKISPCAGSGR